MQELEPEGCTCNHKAKASLRLEVIFIPWAGVPE